VNVNVDTTDFIKSLRRLQESIKMDNVRILKGYSKQERKELEEAKDNGFLSSMTLIHGIGDDDDDCHSLSKKYYRENPNENEQMAKDIIDFYCDKAKFAESKKYYVHFVKGYKNGYLNVHKYTGEIFISTRTGIDNDVFKTAFTDEEIIAIDPRYMAFAVPVEED